MRIDFWNNPLVISAFRVKNRYGALYTNLTLYLLLVGGGIMAAWYLIPEVAAKPIDVRTRLHLIFAGLFVFQTILSALWAMMASSGAMTSEIISGTLDYQRLTSLSPAQVLTGKLLGAPGTAYLAILGAVPFSFVLWTLGASEISFVTLLFLYLQQFATALMAAAVGLVKRLRAGAAQKGVQQGVSGVGFLMVFLFFVLVQAGLTTLLWSPGKTTPIGLLLPLGPMAALFQQQDPWSYGVSVFAISLPFLLITPLVQLVLGALCFVCMIRRLTNTANPPLTKPMAYAVLAGIDMVAAALLFEPGPANPLGPRSTTYWLCHTVAAFFLASYVTPGRELLRSWLWRFRGTCSIVRDLGWHDRSENILVLVMSGMIGITVYILLVAAPAVALDGWNEAQPLDRLVTDSLVLACLALLTLGTFLQMGTFVVGRGGGILVLVPIAIDVAVVLTGEQLGIKAVRQFSVVAHWATWHALVAPLSPLPAIGCQSLLFLCAWVILRVAVCNERVKIERALHRMGVAR